MNASELTANVEVKCASCNYVGTAIISGFEAVDFSERQMGTETEHNCEEDWPCPKCNNSNRIVVKVWEYPEGGFNHHEATVNKREANATLN